jgi:hypothetical protein
MSGTDPNLTPLADCVPADVYYCLVYKLRDILPTPPNPSPQYLARRDNALVGRLAALRLATPIEAEIAADYILATEHADDCLRTALLPETRAEWVVKNRAQANATKRQAYAALTRLERMQAERRKLEKDPQACSGETWAEHCVTGLITQAFAEQPDPDADLLDELDPTDEPDPDTLTPQQQQATIHRQRAALIRKFQLVLKDPSFSDAVAHIIADNSLSADLSRHSARPPPELHSG